MVALPLLPDAPPSQRVFAFLPVRSVGFRFAVQVLTDAGLRWVRFKGRLNSIAPYSTSKKKILSSKVIPS